MAGLKFRSPNRASLGALAVAAMLAMVAIPAGIALHSVRVPAVLEVNNPNPTPYGYTLSLSFFFIPILIIGGWFLPREGLRIPQRAFWRTILILVPFGCALDFFLARYFFFFHNPGATLRILAPALGHWVPLEEYIFYSSGFIAVLLIYIWLDEYWLSAYRPQDYLMEAKTIRRLLVFHSTSVYVGAALVILAELYKKNLSPAPAGFPGYFTFLVVAALIPGAGFFAEARRFINWRAVSLTLFIILLISLLWEGTLAVPYGWWGYQTGQMMGLFIGAWSGLPIEAVCLWIAVTYVTVIIFTIMKLWDASGKPLSKALMGGGTTEVG
jgi:hypothetical protein